MLTDIIEKQQVETKNTLTFLKYVLGKRAPKIPYDWASGRGSGGGGITMPSISVHSNATDMSFRSPRRATVLERARSLLGKDSYKRPADLIKA